MLCTFNTDKLTIDFRFEFNKSYIHIFITRDEINPT